MNSSALPQGRAGGRLRRARDNGYLDAACDRSLPTFHSRWCWRLKIPGVWIERLSPRSRYGRLHLDLFTPPQALTGAGREALGDLRDRFEIAGKVRISAHDACWDRVPIRQLEDLARAVLRAANRPGNYQLDLRVPRAVCGPGTVLPFPQRATA